jgi:hypothetical protein
MAIESLVRKSYFLTSEQSECFESLRIEGVPNMFVKYFLNTY